MEQVTKLEFIKRKVYERGKLGLLEARIFEAPWCHRDCVGHPLPRRLTALLVFGVCETSLHAVGTWFGIDRLVHSLFFRHAGQTPE